MIPDGQHRHRSLKTETLIVDGDRLARLFRDHLEGNPQCKKEDIAFQISGEHLTSAKDTICTVTCGTCKKEIGQCKARIRK